MLKSDIFKWTLVVSIVFHLFIVLGISFVMPEQFEKPVYGPPLKITLVTSASEVAPDQTDTLAQANSLGEEDASAEAPGLKASIEEIVKSTRATEQADNIVSAESSTADLVNKQAQQDSEATRSNLTREQIAQNINLAYLNAQSKPREKYVSARSRESKYAAYVEKWRMLVERVGNLNYPEEAKQHGLEGSLVLDVAISADGEVNKIRVLDSSGYKALDDAAERIVLIAAPFDRFPDAIREEVDTLHIVRTWEFQQGQLKSKNLDLN